MSHRLQFAIVLVLALALGACTPDGGVAVAEARVRVWIDQPLDGAEYAAGETIAIRWHAAAVDGIQQVEVRINGEGLGVSRDFDHAAPLVTQSHDWVPAGPGEYLIQVIATGANGSASLPAQKRVRVLEAEAPGTGGIVRGAVYADLNADGDPDGPGEGPLAGVTVTLSQCADRSQLTGADGTFNFEDLPAGTCLVAVDKPGWVFADTFPSGIGYPARAASDPALLTAFSLFMSATGGIVRGAVYSDLNLDGDAQDAGEAPLGGVTVTIRDCGPGAAQVTGGDGIFSFSDLPPGSCLLTVEKPGWIYVGTFPAGIGYPARAASDPALPTAFSFYMAPAQGGVTPTLTATATRSPVPPTLTRTPFPPTGTPTRTPVPLPTPFASFTADSTSLVAGECTILRWQSGNIESLYLDGEAVAWTGVRTVCPAATSTYALVANYAGGQLARQVTISVTAPPTHTPTSPPPTPTRTRTRTPSPTPDTVGPPAPHIVGPTGGVMLECVAPVTLDWDKPYDPSGISNYRVRLQRWTGADWIDEHVWDPVTTTYVDARNYTDCGIAYRWRVMARDGAGNGGDVSEWAEFSILLP